MRNRGTVGKLVNSIDELHAMLKSCLEIGENADKSAAKSESHKKC